jgi:hypothetical protein
MSTNYWEQRCGGAANSTVAAALWAAGARHRDAGTPQWVGRTRTPEPAPENSRGCSISARTAELKSPAVALRGSI